MFRTAAATGSGGKPSQPLAPLAPPGTVRRDSASDSSSDYDDGSSCDSCDSIHMAFEESKAMERRGTLAAHTYLTRRATMKLKGKAKQVQNAIAAVLSAEKLSRQSASPTSATAPSAAGAYAPALSTTLSTDTPLSAGAPNAPPGAFPLSIGSALARPRNSTPPLVNASPPAGGAATRRASFRRSSFRSTASAGATSSSSDEDEQTDLAHREAELAANAPSEAQIVVAAVLKKGARTKDAIATEMLMRGMKNRQPILPLAEVPSLHATLKPYLEAGSGKSVTQFAAAALAVVFIVRMKHRCASKTVHQQNTERFDYIATLREKKNNCLSKRIHGASTRSMHLHIQKQRAGLRNIMTFAVKESNLRTRDARIGKAGTARGELLKHTEDQLFDRSEYRRGDIGSHGGGTARTMSDAFVEQSMSGGGFSSANFEPVQVATTNASGKELGQFLFDDSGGAVGAGGSGSAIAASGDFGKSSQTGGGGSTAPSTSTMRGRSRQQAHHPQQQAQVATVTTPPQRMHRALDANVVDPHIFTMHHLWRDEPFRDPYVETDKVYQYASQIEKSELFAFTRTTLPNLHLEVMRLKQQLDPTPWEGSAADKKLREGVAAREAARRDRANHSMESKGSGDAPAATARLPPAAATGLPSFLPPVVPPRDAPGTAQTARSSVLPMRQNDSFINTPAVGAVDGVVIQRTDTLTLPTPRGAKATPGTRGASSSPRNASTLLATPSRASTRPSARASPSRPGPAGPSPPPPSAAGAQAKSPSHNGLTAAEALAIKLARSAQVDEDTKAQRREELAVLEGIMEDEHRIAISTFQSFLLHKEMEHSVFASKSIDELRRLVQSNDLIFPMKRVEMLHNSSKKKDRPEIEVTAEQLAKKKVAGVTNYDVFKQLHVAEASVKLQVKQHQEQQSIAYTARWFQTLRTNVERHSGGLSPLATRVFAAFEPLFTSRITSKHGFYAVMANLETIELQQPETQFLLMRLAVPFKVSQTEVEHALRSRGISLVLLDRAYYQKLKDLVELDERRRIRDHNLEHIDSVIRINALMDNAFSKAPLPTVTVAAAVMPSPPRVESKVPPPLRRGFGSEVRNTAATEPPPLPPVQLSL